MPSKTVAITTALVISAAAAAHADTTLSFKTGDNTRSSTVMIRDGMVRMISPNPRGGNEISLYDDRTRTFTVLNEQRKSYMSMDQASIGRQAQALQAMQQQIMAQMQEKMKDMPPEQRKMVEQQMAQMQSQKSAPAPRFDVRKTGRTETVNNFRCEVYESLRDGKPVSDACVANPKALGIPEADYRTVRNMFGFMRNMASQFAAASGMAGQGNPLDSFDAVEGLPVKISSPNGEAMVLEKVSGSKLSPELFAIPSGYKKADMTGGGGMGRQGGR